MHYSEDSNYTPVRLADLGKTVAEAQALIAQIGAAGGEDAYNQAQYEKQVEEQKARQVEINRNHHAERNPGYERNYFLEGTCESRAETNYMPQFRSFGKSDLSIKDTITKLYKEQPFLKSLVLKVGNVDQEDPSQVFDAHAREGRKVAIFSKDGVYRNEVDLDAELADEIPF